MVLHPVALEHLRAAIIAMDRHRHGQRTFGNLEPIAVVGGDLEIVGYQIELLARHAKRGMVVNVHGRKLAGETRPGNDDSLFTNHRPLPRLCRDV